MENKVIVSYETFLNDFFKGKPYKIEALPVDCSFRTYNRIFSNDQTYILMHSPPDKENINRFISVTNYLREIGLSAPEIYLVDSSFGLALIEDFGNYLFKDLLIKQPETGDELYKCAIDLLLYLQTKKLDQSLEFYDDQKLFNEVNLFVEWYYPILFGEEISVNLKNKFTRIWQDLFSKITYKNHCVVLRDYHVENLLLLPNRKSIKKAGVIDYQDAVIGSYAYDLMSLLEDARIEVPKPFREKMINYYLRENTVLNHKNFMADYIILGAQRNCKILGIFARKAMRDNNKKYLQYLPRVWSYINDNMDSPLLSNLREWFLEAKIPAIKRK